MYSSSLGDFPIDACSLVSVPPRLCFIHWLRKDGFCFDTVACSYQILEIFHLWFVYPGDFFYFNLLGAKHSIVFGLGVRKPSLKLSLNGDLRA